MYKTKHINEIRLMENFRRSRSVEQINQIWSIKSNYFFFLDYLCFRSERQSRRAITKSWRHLAIISSLHASRQRRYLELFMLSGRTYRVTTASKEFKWCNGRENQRRIFSIWASYIILNHILRHSWDSIWVMTACSMLMQSFVV